MSEICFCRARRFRALHHYQVPTWDAETNRRRFGDAAKPHEHHWTLTIWLCGSPDPVTGMVVDLVKVDEVLQAEVGRFEGRSFREVEPWFVDHQPTTEVLAGYFAERIAAFFPEVKLKRLRIAEMDDLFAEWTQ